MGFVIWRMFVGIMVCVGTVKFIIPLLSMPYWVEFLLAISCGVLSYIVFTMRPIDDYIACRDS